MFGFHPIVQLSDVPETEGFTPEPVESAKLSASLQIADGLDSADGGEKVLEADAFPPTAIYSKERNKVE